MSNLKIDDKSYEFATLEKKYSGFRAPAYKIFINGKDVVQKEHIGIEEIYVENSIDKADFFSFTVVNAYKFDKSIFEWQENALTIGSKIEIKFGYIDKFNTIFEGYITSVKYDFSQREGASIIVSGMDASFLMMKGKKSFLWLKKKHSDIVDELAKKYKLKAQIKNTSMEFESIVQNNQSDYDFLRYLADLNSYEMFVLGSNLYFREINSSKDSIITLEMNRHMISFNYSIDLGEQVGGVVVRGYNTKKEEIEAKCEKIDGINNGGKNGVSVLRSLDKTNTLHYIYEPLVSKNEAKQIAESMLLKKSMNYVSGDGMCVGIPEIIAGRYIKIKGMFGVKAKTFYITSTVHIFDSTGYTTSFKIGGNEV